MPRIVLIALGIVAVLGILGTAVVFIVLRAPAPSRPRGAAPAARRQEPAELSSELIFRSLLARARARCAGAAEEGRERCEDEATVELAVEEGNEAFCKEIRAADILESCFVNLAAAQGSIAFCEKAGGRREECIALVLTASAAAVTDPAHCSPIADPDLRARCDEARWSQARDVSFCDQELPESQSPCRSFVERQLILASGDVAACERLATEEEREACREELAPSAISPTQDLDRDGLPDVEEHQLGTDALSRDTDGDGLSDAEEARTHKTDPKNPDSDGDGFSDGIEVRAGYNPLGPGRL